MAESRVQLTIGVDASGNASKVVKETRDELDAMGQSAQRAQSGTVGFSQVMQQSFSRLGAAFSGINAVLGSQTDPLIQKLGQGLTAAGAVANVIPGPIGVATAAVAGLATAAFAFKKEMDETDAKIRNLGDSSTQKLKDKLDITVDSAVALQRALADTPKGLQASVEQLAAVQARAKDTTKDAGNAAAELAKAFAAGPKAVQDFQDKFGRFAADAQRLPDIAKRFGLTKEAQGIADAQADATSRLRASTDELLLTEQKRELSAGALADKQKEVASAQGLQRQELESQAATLQQQTAELQSQVDLLARRQAAAQAALDREQKAAKVAKDNSDYVAGQDQGIALVKANIAREESKIPLELDKQSRKRQELVVWSAKQQFIEQQIALVQDNIASGVKTEVQGRIELANLEAEANKLVADQQAKQVKAASSGPTKAQRLDAEKQAQLAVLQASQKQLEADVARNANKSDQLSAELRLNDVRQQTIRLEEEIAKRQAAAEATTAKGRAARLQAIEIETANKQQELIDAENKKSVEFYTKANQLEVEAKKSANAQVEALEKARSASHIAELQSRGKFDEVAQEQQAAAASTYLAAIDKINADADAAVARAEENQVAIAEINRGRLAALAQSSEAYADSISASFDKAFESTLKSIDDTSSKAESIIGAASQKTPLAEVSKSLVGVSGNLQKSAKSWQAYNAAANRGDVDAMAKAQSSLGGALEGTIEASGAAASALVEDEKTKAGILALTEAAASAAAFATGNIVGGTSHAVAAGIYAGVAGGVIPSTSSSASSAETGTATGGGEVAGATGMAASSGGAVTQVFNFNKGFVFGTSQEVAKGMSSTLRNVSGTGYDKRKAV